MSAALGALLVIGQLSVMPDLESTQSRRRSWTEIHAYYQSAVERSGLEEWRRMRDFSRKLEQRPNLQSLITVGSLGCIYVYRDPECTAAKGYILVAPPRPEPGNDQIRIGYFLGTAFNPTALTEFSDSDSAVEFFERCLSQFNF